MSDVRRTPRAQRDIEQVVRHISQDNLSAAVKWLEDTEAFFLLLAAQPHMGEMIRSRRFGNVRRHSRGSYVIYHRPITGGVEVLRILHGARDHQRLI